MYTEEQPAVQDEEPAAEHLENEADMQQPDPLPLTEVTDEAYQLLPEISDEMPVRRKRRWWVWLLVLFLVAAVSAAVVRMVVFPAYRYQMALQELENGNYAEACQHFRDMGDYKDAESLAVEAENSLIYQSGEESFDQGQYLDAIDIFTSLGGFRDAPQRVEQAEQYLRTEQTCQKAERTSASGDTIKAYEMLTELEVPDFPGVSEIREAILQKAYQTCVSYIDEGNRLGALIRLDWLESVGYGPAEDLRASLMTPMELDYSYYEGLDPQAPGSFNLQTMTKETALIFLDMFLSGETSRTLPARGGTGPYSESAINALLKAMLAGYDLAEECMAEYGSIYQCSHVDIYWEDYRPVSVFLQTDYNNPYTDDELHSHIEVVDTFCRESVLALNRAGLLDDTMTNQQKAHIIFDWLCYYLNYDDTKEIHNAAIAVQGNLGVCESYTGIYNRMCNLAGVPTYAQIGYTENSEDGETHIWSIQLNEAGRVFYTDVTWGDELSLSFGAEKPVESPSVEDFLECYLTSKRYTSAESFPGESRPGMSAYLWANDNYFWSTTLWSSHTQIRSAEEIIAFAQMVSSSSVE
ncbi:MAG: transglutaminase domain-containing protein [Oscillospiraceae bacterium]